MVERPLETFDLLSKEVQTIPITTKMLTGTITGTKSSKKASGNKKGLDEIIQAFDLIGASEGIRTPDRLITNPKFTRIQQQDTTNNNN